MLSKNTPELQAQGEGVRVLLARLGTARLADVRLLCTEIYKRTIKIIYDKLD